jgi:hypothetical protein
MAHAGWKAARQRKAGKTVAIVVARSVLAQLGAQHGHRGCRCRRGAPVRSVGAGSIGALAVGAISMGAGALGGLAIGKLAVKRGTVGSLRVQELSVGRLQVEELSVLKRTDT